MADQETQGQVIETEVTPEPGPTEEGQVTEPVTEAPKPGGEKEVIKQVAPKVKTFTEAEVTAREAEITSTLQKQRAESEAQLYRLRMEEQIRQAQKAEDDATAQDKAQVEQGYIGEDVVEQRKQARQVTKQYIQQAQGIGQVVEQLRQEGEMLGMLSAVYHTAKDVAKEDGLNEFQTMELFEQLMRGERPKSPDQVKGKIAELRLKKAKEALRAATATSETFDKGPGVANVGGMGIEGLEKLNRDIQAGKITYKEYEKQVSKIKV